MIVALYFAVGLVAALGSMTLGALLFRWGQKSLFSWLEMPYPTREELIQASRDAMENILSENDADAEGEY